MQSIETVPSPSLDFTGQKTLGVVASTNHVEIAPKYGGTFKAGEIIRLEIPSQNWLDGEKFRVTFRGKTYNSKANTTGIPLYGGGESRYPRQDNKSYGMFKNGVQHVFNRVKLLQGSRVLEDIQEYGQLAHLMNVISAPRDHSEELLNKEGFAVTDNFDHFQERKMQPTRSDGHMYEVEFFLGLFRTGKYLPTKYMGQLTLELYLEANSACLLSSMSATEIAAVPIASWCTATGALTPDYSDLSYQITDVNAQCHFVVPIDEYDRAALSQIEAGSFEIHYDTFRSHVRQITAVGRQTASIQEKALSIKNIFTVMRNQAGLNSFVHDTHLAKNGLLEYQWKIGNEYFPAQPVRCDDGGVRALTQLREALGGTSDMLVNGQLTRNSYCPKQLKNATDAYYPVENGTNPSSNRRDRKIWDELVHHQSMPHHFVFGQSFEKSQGQLSGFNTVESQVDVELIITLSNHQTANGTVTVDTKFQPLKIPVHVNGTDDTIIPETIPVENILYQRIAAATQADLDIAPSYNPEATGAQKLQDQSGLSYYMREDPSANDFTQILSFVQVDAILRMRGLGQLEVVS